MRSFFGIDPIILQKLSGVEAEDFFHKLLFAEATNQNVPKSKVHTSWKTNDPDGGIDSSVDEVSPLKNDWIKEGVTGYQIKAGDFKPFQKSEIKKEIFTKTGMLKSSIKTILDNNGSYILVCFGLSLQFHNRNKAVKIIRDFLKEQGYEDPKVEVWGQDELIGFIQTFPSLVLNLKRINDTRFQDYKSWASNDDMSKEFKAGDEQKDFLANLRNRLLSTEDTSHAIHIHVAGEPGIGKTKLVFEAIKVEELHSLVVYFREASLFIESELMYELLQQDNSNSVVLIIDECNANSRTIIWNRLKNRGSRIKIVTIYNEFENGSMLPLLVAPKLADEQIKEIIQLYNIPENEAARFSYLCDGSPRVAHIVGMNLQNNPSDLLKSPNGADVWNRYIEGNDIHNSQLVERRKRVLFHIALFKRFGYSNNVSSEGDTIARIVKMADPSITPSIFAEIINGLRERKLLQGESTLYITPKLLHIYLWAEWWRIYGNNFNLSEFNNYLATTPQLLEWFYEMFRYANSSNAAKPVVKKLFGMTGPFQSDKEFLKTKLGANFFLALTEADPKTALECLKKTVGIWNYQELLDFKTGRREIIWALEKIVVWWDLFVGAANLLLALAEAENDTIYANNASGVFAELFSNGYGSVASTEASPVVRFPVLQQALTSDSKKRRLLAIRACSFGLRSDNFVRHIGAEYQGLREQPKLWEPKDYGEWFESFRRIWKLLIEHLDHLPEDEQKQVSKILLHSVYNLGKTPYLAEMVISGFEKLAEKQYLTKKELLTPILQMLHLSGKDLRPEIRQKWEKFRDSLFGNDIPHSVKRYAGMSLVEDLFDELGNTKQDSPYQMKELIQSIVKDNSVILPELIWLVTEAAENGYNFGYELGKADKEFLLLSKIINEQRAATEKASVLFLGGYLRSLLENDEVRWEELLDILAKDEKLYFWVPELTFRAKLTNRAGQRIFEMVKSGSIEVSTFRLFCSGNIQNISQETLDKWLELLVNNDDANALSIALNLLYFYYILGSSRPTLPEDLSSKILTHKVFFQPSKHHKSDYYYWNEVGETFVNQYPHRSLDLAELVLSHFGEENVITSHPLSVQEVLNRIAKLYPKQVWKIVIKYLGPPIDSRAYNIKEWLHGGFAQQIDGNGGGMLNEFPTEEIWKWVEEDTENRAWYLASFVPKMLFPDSTQISFAREVLIRYGVREEVKSNLKANFWGDSGNGPASLRFQLKKQKLLDFKITEKEEIIRSWIDEFVEELDQDIIRFKIMEEREQY